MGREVNQVSLNVAVETWALFYFFLKAKFTICVMFNTKLTVTLGMSLKQALPKQRKIFPFLFPPHLPRAVTVIFN